MAECTHNCDSCGEKCEKRDFHVNLHKDTVEVVKQLKDSGRIELDNFLWKGKLRIRKNKKQVV